jgi:hypothetical protein
MTYLFAFAPLLLFIAVITATLLLAHRSGRRQQERLDAEYAEEKALSDSAGQWPEDGCHWCGSTDAKLDHIMHRCDYCAELHKLTGPVRDPRFPPFKMTMIW